MDVDDDDDDTGVERMSWSKDCTETVAVYQYPRSCGFPIVNVTSKIRGHRGSSFKTMIMPFKIQQKCRIYQNRSPADALAGSEKAPDL